MTNTRYDEAMALTYAMAVLYSLDERRETKMANKTQSILPTVQIPLEKIENLRKAYAAIATHKFNNVSPGELLPIMSALSAIGEIMSIADNQMKVSVTPEPSRDLRDRNVDYPGDSLGISG